MPVIELTKTVNSPVAGLIEVARDVERYPEFMPDVESVAVLTRNEDGTRLVAEWVGRVPQFGLRLRWTQEDRWDLDRHRVEFAQVQGDYDKLQGYWEFRPADGLTEFRSYLDYEYKVPLLGPLACKVVEYVVRRNLNNVMDAIKERAEAGARSP